MLDQQGQVVQGKVAAVKEDTVAMDFNHPMAGKTLNFSGNVVSVREATQKELTEGLHGEYLPEEEHCCKKGKGGCHRGDKKEGECCKEKVTAIATATTKIAIAINSARPSLRAVSLP